MAIQRVQNSGLARVTQLLAAATWWLGWGTGAGVAKSANNLAVAAAEARSAATPSQQTTGGATNDTLRLTATITATGTRAITEVGAFDAVSAGNLDIYGDFTVINLANGDSIAFTMDTRFQSP